MFLADLHIHSNFSDGKMTIPELVDFYGRRGFGAIAITDHICEESTLIGVAAHTLGKSLSKALFPLYLEVLYSEAERAWDQYQMLVIPGFELSKNSLANRRSAHVLALGVSEFVSADDDLFTMIRNCHSQGSLTVAAHPVSTRMWEKQTLHLWDRRHELSPILDAWEVASGPILFPEVLSSGLPMLANSDLHHSKQINSWKTVFQCEKNPEAIFQAIRKRQVHFHFYHEELKDESYRDIRFRLLDTQSQFTHLRNILSCSPLP